jgi:exodeoxyribonuclease VII large subunit
MKSVLARQLERNEDRLLALQQHLHLLDPNQVLARGYSLVRNAKGDIVIDSQQIKTSEALDVRFAQGGARVQVQEILEPKAV